MSDRPTPSKSIKEEIFVLFLDWVFFVLAALLAIGIGGVIFACFMSTPPTYLPIALFPFLIFFPVPILVASHCSNDSLFSSQKAGPAVEFGFFLTGLLLTSIFAMPLVFYHVGRMNAFATIFSMVGSLLVLISGFTFQMVYNSASEE